MYFLRGKFENIFFERVSLEMYCLREQFLKNLFFKMTILKKYFKKAFQRSVILYKSSNNVKFIHIIIAHSRNKVIINQILPDKFAEPKHRNKKVSYTKSKS